MVHAFVMLAEALAAVAARLEEFYGTLQHVQNPVPHRTLVYHLIVAELLATTAAIPFSNWVH